MKKMKLAVAFAAFVSVFTFSSCLDSDGSSGSNANFWIVNVESGYLGTTTFAPDNVQGITWTPSTTSMTLSGLKEGTKRAAVWFTVPEGQDLETAKNIQIELEPSSCTAIPITNISNQPDTLKDYTSAAYAFAKPFNGLFPVIYSNKQYLMVSCSYYASKIAKMGMMVDRVSETKDTLYLDLKMQIERGDYFVNSYEFLQTHYDLSSLRNNEKVNLGDMQPSNDSICVTVRALTSESGSSRLDSVTTKVKFSSMY